MRLYSLILLLAMSTLQLNAQIERIEPPCWWVGMKNPELQLMVHGNDISTSSVEINHPGVELVSVQTTDNPNYLFINLSIGKKAGAGTFTIDFKKKGSKKVSVNYSLFAREKDSAEREGFNNSDVIYLLMPDRFANGDTTNDVIKGMRETVVNRKKITGRHGGDLKGVTDHLDYIGDMGFTAVWLNPFLENDVERSSYHGYSTTDFYKVDPRCGSNDDFIELVEEANNKGIKIIMDMIFNHIGIDHWWMKDLPASDWINFNDTYVQSNHRRTVNQDPYASEYDRKLMVEGWFVRSMPDLNQRNPLLATYLVQNSIWWIEEAGLAGIRMDTYPYPEKTMMAEWNLRVREEYPNFNIVGEEWSTNPGLVSYWQEGKINTDGYDGHLPSLMDFPLQSALTASLVEKEEWNTGWIKLYETIASDYQYPDPYNLVVFPDNHDMSRFYMQLAMNERLYKLGITYILTTRGIPQIFYGSEILMTHKEDAHHGQIRKDFPGGWKGDSINGFTGEGLAKNELKMQAFFKKLLNWRKENPVIHSGKMIHFAPEKGVYVYGRYNEDKTVMVLLNKGSRKVTLETERFDELSGQFNRGIDVISGKEYVLTDTISVPAVTGLILELTK